MFPDWELPPRWAPDPWPGCCGDEGRCCHGPTSCREAGSSGPALGPHLLGQTLGEAHLVLEEEVEGGGVRGRGEGARAPEVGVSTGRAEATGSGHC